MTTIHLECLYCGYSWKIKLYGDPEVVDLPSCKACKEKNNIKGTKLIDYYNLKVNKNLKKGSNGALP